MYCPKYSNESLDAVIASAQKYIRDLVSQLQPDSEEVLHSRGTDLIELARKESHFFLLCSGQVELIIADKAVLMYEVGDLIGIEALSPLNCKAVSSEFATKSICIPLTIIEETFGPRALLTLFSHFSAIFYQAFAAGLPIEQESDQKIERFEDGQVIVEQGSYSEEIYTLIEGNAEAFVDGKKVGEIQTDEVFGALAAMTNMGRTATIKSCGPTLVLGIKKDRLIELIKMRPGTVEKLIGDLARVIKDLNKKLAGKF